MKKPLLLLAAAGTLALTVAVPNTARAGGQISFDVHIGVPVPMYRPHVVYGPVYYQPIVAYGARPFCPPPAAYYRPAYHDYRYYGRYRGYASAYPSYRERRIAEVQVNPRLGR